jgi:YegS/Rv2252/BmrU family lipid kinase
MTKLFVIFNPAARGENPRGLQRFLAGRPADALTLAATERAGDAQQLAADAVAAGSEMIVAAGGDGTINEVVNGIGTSGVPLGVLRVGTVNVFARELGIPGDLAAAWAVLERGRVREVDLGYAEPMDDGGGTGPPRDAGGGRGGKRRYFVQLAGVGFDAWAVQHASWKLKKMIGPLSYVWAGLKAVARPCAPVQVTMSNGRTAPLRAGSLPGDGEAITARGAVVLIGNGRFYGGAFAVFPRARLDDGRLDVCVFAKSGYWDVLRYAQGVVRGAHTRARDVTYWQGAEFICRTDGAAVPFEVDGELAGTTPVRFGVLPRALRVVVP